MIQADRVLQALVPDPLCMGRVTLRDMAANLESTTTRVRFSLYGLMERGLARRCWKGVYSITPAGLKHLLAGKAITSGPKGPRTTTSPFAPSTLRSRLWRALRLKRVASVDELMILASRGNEGNPREDAKKYLNALIRAGIVTLTATSRGPRRYLLLQDTGPQAPQWNKRQKRVFDPNTGTTHDLEASHDLA